MLPSNLAPGKISHLSFKLMAMIERKLQKGQVTDALEGLWLALCEKSLCFHTEVCNANSQWTTHWAWDNVRKMDAEARKHHFFYLQARGALHHLCNDGKYLATLHDIMENDMKVVGDLTNEQGVGQQSDTIAWFW